MLAWQDNYRVKQSYECKGNTAPEGQELHCQKYSRDPNPDFF